MPAPDKPSGELTNEVWKALSKRVCTLSADLAIKTAVSDELLAALQAISTASDPLAVARAMIREQTTRARQLLQLLEGLSAEVEVQEKRRAWLERFSDEWWRSRRAMALEANSSSAARSWLQAFADALLAGEYDAALRWTELELSRAVAASLPLDRCRFAARALAAGLFVEARPVLKDLVSVSEKANMLDATAEGELLAFAARIHLFDLNAPGEAFGCLKEAMERAPHSHAVNAARSDYHTKRDQPDFAAEYAQRAIQCDPDAPEGFVALGAWAEGRKRWSEAKEHYDRVGKLLREHPQPWRSLGRMRTKFSGLVALRVARKLEQAERGAMALEGVNHAILLGVSDEGEYPEVEAYEFQAQVLAGLKHPAVEIAEALYQAGRRRQWRNETVAAKKLFQRAIEHDSNLPGPHWHLADTLLTESEIKQPPYADAALVAEAAREWDRTAEKHRLDPGMSWPYVTKALICGQQAVLPGESKIDLWWQAVSWLECAVVLRPLDTQNLAHLGRYFGLLQMEACALQVTAKALEVSPDNALVLNQRAIIMANTGHYAEAEAVINKRLKAEPDAVWERGVKAFILYYQHRYLEALELVNAAIEMAPDEAWYRDIRALCWRGVKREDKAREDFVWLVEKWRSTGQLPDLAFGWAALNIGEFRTGFEILDGVCRDLAMLASTERSFRGLAALAIDELEIATADLEAGVRQAINLHETHEMLDIGLPWAEAASAQWPHGETARQIIARTREQHLTRQREMAAHPRSPESEIREALATAVKPGNDPGWIWIGAHALLARLEMEQGEEGDRIQKERDAAPSLAAARQHWQAAARIYAELLPWQKHFREAGRGLGQAQARLLGAADELWRRGGEAEAGWREALALIPDSVPAVAGLRGEAHCRLAVAEVARAEYRAASALFNQALDDFRSAGEPRPGQRLAQICQPLLRTPADYWALLDVWRRDANELNAEQCSLAVNTLTPALETTYRLGPTDLILPVVTPIVVEMGADLSPLKGQLDAALPAMRKRLLQSMGWRAPGVRYRLSNDILADSYIISLEEVPTIMGTLPAGRRFTPATAPQLRDAGVSDTSFTEAPDPTDPTGIRKGCWVAETIADKLAAQNLDVWPQREDYLIRQLETLLRHSAVSFVGLQDVADLLREWKEDATNGPLAASFLADRNLMLGLRRLLRALLVELVPITRWPVILEAVKGFNLESNDILPLLCETRRRLRDQLPGNEPGMRRVPLDRVQEKALMPWLRHKGGQWFFAISPEETQGFLARARELTAKHGAHFALIVHNAELRVFIRRMVQLEFVGLMVLAADELSEQQSALQVPAAQDYPLGEANALDTSVIRT